jgi:hypothetical protein
MATDEKTMDDTLIEDWAAIREKYAVPEEVEEKAEEPEQPETEETEETGKEPSERPRDEKGRFLGKPEEAAGSTAESPQHSQAADSTPASPFERPPSSWKPAERELWKDLSPEVRAAINRRETDFLNGQQQLLPDAQLGKNLRGVIEPYRMLIEAEGGTPERAVADLLRTAAIFRVGTPQQKYEAIAQIANQFGLDLSVFSRQAPAQGNGQAPPQGQFYDPRVDQLLAQQRQQESARQQQEERQTESIVTRWMDEKDERGEPKRPYIGDVINEMSALLPQIRQENPSLTYAQALEQGYERAVWAHPEIRTILQQKAASDLEAKRRSDNQQRTREAKRAASVNVPRRGSLPGKEKPGSLEETIAATARELGLIS